MLLRSVASSTTDNCQHKLISELLSPDVYDTSMRPVTSFNQTVNINISSSLSQITDLVCSDDFLFQLSQYIITVKLFCILRAKDYRDTNCFRCIACNEKLPVCKALHTYTLYYCTISLSTEWSLCSTMA